MNSHLAGLLAALKLMKTKNKLKLTVLFMNFLKYDSAEGESGEMKLTSNFSSHRSRTALVKKKKKEREFWSSICLSTSVSITLQCLKKDFHDSIDRQPSLISFCELVLSLRLRTSPVLSGVELHIMFSSLLIP